MFIFPCATVRKIETILSAFLWKGTALTHRGAKVAWTSLCYPLQEGGLGIKSIKTWNKAALLKHVWRLLSEGTLVWVIWVHSVLLRGHCFWYIRLLHLEGTLLRKLLNWFSMGTAQGFQAIGLIVSSNLVSRTYSSSSFHSLGSLYGASAYHGQAHLLPYHLFLNLRSMWHAWWDARPPFLQMNILSHIVE